MSYNEFVYGLERIGVKLSNDDVRKVFKHIDINNDGKIGFNQFILLSEEN